MTVNVGQRLNELADRDRGQGLDDPANIEAHYANFGVHAPEMVEAVVAYLTNGGRVNIPTHILQVAVSVAGRMFEVGHEVGLEKPHIYPYPDGDTVILGPQVFVSKDRKVISWQGENYYLRSDGRFQRRDAQAPERGGVDA